MTYFAGPPTVYNRRQRNDSVRTTKIGTPATIAE